jgi:hypothetical protein
MINNAHHFVVYFGQFTTSLGETCDVRWKRTIRVIASVLHRETIIREFDQIPHALVSWLHWRTFW